MSTKQGGQGKGHTSKHVGSKKHHVNHHAKHHPKHHVQHHHVHHKHHVHVKGKHGHHARGYAIGDLLPVCTFEALAMSLRLAGQRVAEDDLLELWHHAGACEVSIAEALDAAARFGLAGCRPVYATAAIGSRCVYSPQCSSQDGCPGQCSSQPAYHVSQTGGSPHFGDMGRLQDVMGPMLLGIEVPGPHAVLATPDGWWSWGELWSPWTRHVSEAWVISWQ